MNEENAIKYSIILEFINRTQELEAAVQRIQQQLQELQSRSRDATEESEGAIEAVVSSLAFLYAGRAILTRYLIPSIEIASSIEQWRVSLGVFYGDLVKTNKTMESMMEFARRTPFTLPQVIAAGRQLAAYRLEVEEWLPVLGDLAAAVGRDIVEISYIFGYMAGERWGEFFEAIARIGIPRKEFERFGVQIEASTGRVKSSAKEIRNALKSIVKEHFSGIQEILAKTAIGLKSMVEDAKTRLKEMFMLGITNFEKMEENSISMFATYKRFLQVSKAFYELPAIQTFFAGLSKGLGGIFSVLIALSNLILSIVQMINSIKGLSFLTEATGRVLGMALAIGILVQAFKSLRAVWTILFSTKNLEVFSAILSFLTNKNVQLKGIFSETLSVVRSLLSLDFKGLKSNLENVFASLRGGSERTAFSLGMLFASLKSGLATIGKYALSFAILLALSYLLEWLFKKLWDTIARAQERSKRFYEELSENMRALRDLIKNFLDYFDKMLDTELRIGEHRVKILTDIYDQERALMLYREAAAEKRYKWELERIKILRETGIISQDEADLMTALAQKQYMLSLYEEKSARVLETKRMLHETSLAVQTSELEYQMKLLELEKARYEALGEGYEPLVRQLNIRIAELEYEQQKIALIDEYVEKLSTVGAMDEKVRELLLQHFRLRLQTLWIDKEITKEREKQKKQMSDVYVWVFKQNKLQLAALSELQKKAVPTTVNFQAVSFAKEEKDLLSKVTSSNVLAARANKEASDAVWRSTKLFEINRLEIIKVLMDLKDLLNKYIALLQEQMALAKGRVIEPIKYVDINELNSNIKKASSTLGKIKLLEQTEDLRQKYQQAYEDWKKGIAGAEEKLRAISIQLKMHSDFLGEISKNSLVFSEFSQKMSKEQFPSLLGYLYNTVKTTSDIKKALPAAKLFTMFYQAYKDFSDFIGVYLEPKDRATIFQKLFGSKYQRIFNLTGEEQEKAVQSLSEEVELFRQNVQSLYNLLLLTPIEFRKPLQEIVLSKIKTATKPEEISNLIYLLNTLPDLLVGKYRPVSQKILYALKNAKISEIPNLVAGLQGLTNLPDKFLGAILEKIKATPEKDLPSLLMKLSQIGLDVQKKYLERRGKFNTEDLKNFEEMLKKLGVKLSYTVEPVPQKISWIYEQNLDLSKLLALSQSQNSAKEININLNNYFTINGEVNKQNIEEINLSVERAVRNALLSAKYEV